MIRRALGDDGLIATLHTSHANCIVVPQRIHSRSDGVVFGVMLLRLCTPLPAIENGWAAACFVFATAYQVPWRADIRRTLKERATSDLPKNDKDNDAGDYAQAIA